MKYVKTGLINHILPIFSKNTNTDCCFLLYGTEGYFYPLFPCAVLLPWSICSPLFLCGVGKLNTVRHEFHFELWLWSCQTHKRLIAGVSPVWWHQANDPLNTGFRTRAAEESPYQPQQVLQLQGLTSSFPKMVLHFPPTGLFWKSSCLSIRSSALKNSSRCLCVPRMADIFKHSTAH